MHSEYHTDTKEICPECLLPLVCLSCWIGGGSHYWHLQCTTCQRQYQFDTYRFQLEELSTFHMNPELMKNWFVVQNGKRIDIHVIHPTERREITVVADVRDEACANLIANAWRYKEALEAITQQTREIGALVQIAQKALNPLGVSGKPA